MPIQIEDGSGNGPHHKRIVKTERMRIGWMVDLECGHQVLAFGDLQYAGGVVLCTACREQEAACGYCQEPIPPEELADCNQRHHWYCLLRMAAGSVAHQEGRCSCFVPGSTEGDPPGLTLREAARQAAAHYNRRHGNAQAN